MDDILNHGALVVCQQIPKVYTHYAATALFFFFGIKSLYDALIKEDEVSAACMEKSHGMHGY